ncbi:hypothetical protein N9C81_02185 [Planctomycetota bacterium]|nr:hypothetical protein [Planctomycetota bacterium]
MPDKENDTLDLQSSAYNEIIYRTIVHLFLSRLTQNPLLRNSDSLSFATIKEFLPISSDLSNDNPNSLSSLLSSVSEYILRTERGIHPLFTEVLNDGPDHIHSINGILYTLFADQKITQEPYTLDILKHGVSMNGELIKHPGGTPALREKEYDFRSKYFKRRTLIIARDRILNADSTLESVGARHNITRERVRQIVGKFQKRILSHNSLMSYKLLRELAQNGQIERYDFSAYLDEYEEDLLDALIHHILFTEEIGLECEAVDSKRIYRIPSVIGKCELYLEAHLRDHHVLLDNIVNNPSIRDFPEGHDLIASAGPYRLREHLDENYDYKPELEAWVPRGQAEPSGNIRIIREVLKREGRFTKEDMSITSYSTNRIISDVVGRVGDDWCYYDRASARIYVDGNGPGRRFSGSRKAILLQVLEEHPEGISFTDLCQNQRLGHSVQYLKSMKYLEEVGYKDTVDIWILKENGGTPWRKALKFPVPRGVGHDQDSTSVRLTITHEHLRGSGVAINEFIPTSLGVRQIGPMIEFFDENDHRITIKHAIVNGSMSSIREILEKESLRLGDCITFKFFKARPIFEYTINNNHARN